MLLCSMGGKINYIREGSSHFCNCNSKWMYNFNKKKDTKESGNFYFKISIMLSITIANDNLLYYDFLHTYFGTRFFNLSHCHCLGFISVVSEFPFGPLWVSLCYLSVGQFLLAFPSSSPWPLPLLDPFVSNLLSKFCNISNSVYENIAFSNLRQNLFLL